ncbi:MAG: signal peptidase II [Planctomycetota bacterium]
MPESANPTVDRPPVTGPPLNVQPVGRLPVSRYLVFLSVATLGCAADLLTKQAVFDHPQLFRGSEWWLWQGRLGIQKSLNEGALFGMGQGKVWLFAAFSFAAMIGIPIWLFLFKAASHRGLNITLGCVMGGVLGNLYDRLGMHGMDWGQYQPSRAGERIYAVRDWILVQWNPDWVWPNFNIADALLVAGSILLVWISTSEGAPFGQAPNNS